MRRSLLLIPVALAVAVTIVVSQREINERVQQGVMAVATVAERLAAVVRKSPEPSVTVEPPPAPLWSVDLPWLASRPVVDPDGRVITTTREDLLILGTSGDELHRASLADGGDAFPGALRRLADGRIVLPVLGAIMVFAADGAPLAKYPLAETTVRPRVLAETGPGSLVLNLFESNAWGAKSTLLVLDLANGAERWRFDARQHRIDWALPIADGRLLVSIGGTRWEFDAGGARRAAEGDHRIFGLPLVVNDAGEFVWVPAAGSDEPAPAVRASYRVQSMPCQPIHVVLTASDLAYAGCGSVVYAITAAGVIAWSRDLGWVSPLPLSRAPDGGVIALVGHGVVALTPTGEQRFRTDFWRRLEIEGIDPQTLPVQPSGALLQGPDGTLYVGTQDNGVYALAADGTIRWNFTARASGSDSGFVTQLGFLDDTLLVSAARLIALPAPGARLEPIIGVPFHDNYYD